MTLSSQLYVAQQQGLLSSVPIARGMVRMSQLFYASACLLFCQENMHE